VIGDLIEEYALRQAHSSRRVSWWYWRQVCGSVLPLLSTAVGRERWPGILGAAIAAYAIVTIVESAATLAISRLLGPDTLAQDAMSLVTGLSAMVLGGYIAAWIRRGAAATLAVIIALVVIALMVTMSESVPVWYQIGFLVVGPLAALAGGALLRRTRCEKQSS
jgi:hypothetical protein